MFQYSPTFKLQTIQLFWRGLFARWFVCSVWWNSLVPCNYCTLCVKCVLISQQSCWIFWNVSTKSSLRFNATYLPSEPRTGLVTEVPQGAETGRRVEGSSGMGVGEGSSRGICTSPGCLAKCTLWLYYENIWKPLKTENLTFFERGWGGGKILYEEIIIYASLIVWYSSWIDVRPNEEWSGKTAKYRLLGPGFNNVRSIPSIML